MDISTEQDKFVVQTLKNNLPIGIVICDFNVYFTIKEASKGFFTLTGYTPLDLEEQFHRQLTELIHPDDYQSVSEKISKQFLNNECISFNCRLRCKDGYYKEIEYRGQFIYNDYGTEQLFGLMMEQAKDKNRSKDTLFISEDLSPFLGKHDIGLNSPGLMVCEWNIASDVLVYSHNWHSGSGGTPQYNQVCRQSLLHARIHPSDLPDYMGLLEELRGGGLYATAEFRLFNTKEEYIWCRVHALTMYNRQEKPVKAVGIIFDVDEQKRAMDELKVRAERDALTGLFNKNETESKIKACLDGGPTDSCCLFMIDTDNFKQVNDTKGHMLGDIVLKEMALGMKKTMRENDVIGRIGGDEFTIFVEHISRKEAAQKAGELSMMFRHLFENDKNSLCITCSIGVALYPEDGSDFKTLYRHADQALYQAKSRGKDGYVIYDEKDSGPIEGNGLTTLGAVIESETASAGIAGDLLTYIFKLLYNMEDLNQAVNLSLEATGKWFDVSRAYIFETGRDEEYYKNTYEWCGDGILPEIEYLQHVDAQSAGDYRELFGENSVYYCRNTHVLPPLQRKLFEDQGIHSVLQYALWDNGRFAGFIGFDECTGLRLWTKEEATALEQISELLDIFIKKKKLQERLQMTQHLTRSIIEKEAEYIYVIKKGSYEVLYTNSRMKQLIPGLVPGVLCHKALYYGEQPCEFCPLKGGHLDSGQNNICTLVSAAPLEWEGEEASIIAFHHIDERITGQNIGTIKNRGQYIADEKGIMDCMQWLATSEYLEDSIDYVLSVILDYYQSDRVYIVEIDEEKDTASNTYEICADGVIPQIENLQNVPIETISFWMKQFAIRDYIKIDDIGELGPERQLEYNILNEQGIKGLMALPLHVKGEVKGFLGLDDPKTNKANFHYLEELTYFLENEITKNSLRKNMERMNYEDPLTGLENRNSYMIYCDDFSKRLPVPVGVVFMDINGLKKLNGARGHVYGDMVITHVADTMKQYFQNSRKFRLSGDEFLIVTESISYDEFQKQLYLMEEKLTTNGAAVVSAGTTWSDVGMELTELMNKADRLMQINKQDYYKGYKEIASAKMPLLKEVMESIVAKQYLIYLQPKYNLKTQRVDRAEVLVRYREKDGSISSPIKFIPLLESEGLISNIDFFVMEEVCKLLTKWKDTAFADIQLSFNFSRITMFDKNFFNEFWGIFRRYDLKPEQVEVEITETQETLNKKQMALLLEELKNHQFEIALDDFGVEYSSYEFLMMADFDVLKIDKGIIQKYENTARGKTLVRHIVEMAHSIGVRCCAEGVETKEQFDFIREIGCDYVQGYLIDRPIPVEQFEMKYEHFTPDLELCKG